MSKPLLGEWIRSKNPRKSVSGAARATGVDRRGLIRYWLGERSFPMARPTAQRLARYIGVSVQTVLRNFSPAPCAGCAARDRRIAELEREVQGVRQRLEAVTAAAAGK